MKDSVAINRKKQQDKIDFIMANFDITKIDPYLDMKIVDLIKKALFNNGYYENRGWWDIGDTTLINLILKAQGKYIGYRKAHSKKQNNKEGSI